MNAVVVAGRAGTALRGRLTLLGPALVASAAYVDPGNVVTNTVAGARYAYLLVWVVVLANVTAGFVQYLSAKFGIVTGQSLPEALGARLRPAARLTYWAQAELVTMATDLAEVVGGAIALQMLFGTPLVDGAVIVAVISMLVFKAHRVVGGQSLERAVTAMLLVVGVGFVAGLLVAPPHAASVLAGARPALHGGDSLLIAVGMFGATVMPHAIYAHSALARDRHGRAVGGARRDVLLRATRLDVGVALTGAGAVNLVLLLLGATVVTAPDATLGDIHAALAAHLGAVVGVFFAVGLLFSGIASTSVGCYSGAIVTGGLVRLRIPLLLRRAITAVPAVIVLSLGTDPTRVLLYSQVVLSFGIPFALVPLVVLSSRRAVMGDGVNRPGTTAAAAGACAAIVALNVVLLALIARGTS